MELFYKNIDNCEKYKKLLNTVIFCPILWKILIEYFTLIFIFFETVSISQEITEYKRILAINLKKLNFNCGNLFKLVLVVHKCTYICMYVCSV